MKKLALLSAILLLLPVASAVQISSYDLEAAIDGTSVNEKLLIFADYQSETSLVLLLPPGVRNLAASINDVPVSCQQKEILGATKVTCPVSAKTDYFAKLNFDTTFPIVTLGDSILFNQHLSFPQTFEKFTFRLKLPERAVLPEESSKFVSPEPTRIYSDGRRIILSYEANNVDKFDVSVIYEPSKETPVGAFLAILFLILVALGFVLLRTRKKAKPEVKETPAEIERPKKKVKKEPTVEEKLYLLPDENGVIHILKQAGKPIRQRDIENQITFSKAKLSRILRGLEERGIIKRTPRGNTNLIELLKG